MRCIHCQTDSKYKERPDGRCPKCKREFAFEPQQGAKFTDSVFQHAIDRISAEGKIAWGAEHLRYALQRRPVVKGLYLIPLVLFIIIVVIVGMWVLRLPMVEMKAAIVPAAFILFVAFCFCMWQSQRLSQPRSLISEQEFCIMLDRWQNVHGTPRGLIVRNPSSTPLKGSDPDLADYSFDRAVICDRARTVDLLIANNFHFENNCAVLAFKGYPERIFATVKAMLMRNPRLKVFVLHDATPEGCSLAYHVANDPSWFRGGTLVIDVGLRPEHAQAIPGFRHDEARTVPAGQGVDAAEAAWLSRHSLELAVIPPEQVIKRLFRAVSAPINRSDAQREGFLIDRASFKVQARASDGGADSFG